jgi:uncharacterized protein (DUF486 family)
MNNFLKWFNESLLASYLRVLLTVIISNMVADFAKVGDFDVTNWRTWVISALVSGLPTLLRWLNPKDELGEK